MTGLENSLYSTDNLHVLRKIFSRHLSGSWVRNTAWGILLSNLKCGVCGNIPNHCFKADFFRTKTKLNIYVISNDPTMN